MFKGFGIFSFRLGRQTITITSKGLFFILTGRKHFQKNICHDRKGFVDKIIISLKTTHSVKNFLPACHTELSPSLELFEWPWLLDVAVLKEFDSHDVA